MWKKFDWRAGGARHGGVASMGAGGLMPVLLGGAFAASLRRHFGPVKPQYREEKHQGVRLRDAVPFQGK